MYAFLHGNMTLVVFSKQCIGKLVDNNGSNPAFWLPPMPTATATAVAILVVVVFVAVTVTVSVARRSAASARQKDIWCKSPTCKSTRYLPISQWSRKEVHPRGHGGIPLSCASCWFNDAQCTKLTCVWTSSTYRNDDAKMLTILRLCSITRGCNHHILSKQHETHNTQQRIVPTRTQVPQQSRRPHVNGRQWGHSHHQWSGTQHIAANKSSDVIGCRSRTWRIIHQRQNGSLHAMHSQRNGTSTNLHPRTNQQLNCPCTTHQQNYAQGFEGHRHEIPLVALPQSTGPVSFLLETWNPKFGRLLDQAPASQPL